MTLRVKNSGAEIQIWGIKHESMHSTRKPKYLYSPIEQVNAKLSVLVAAGYVLVTLQQFVTEKYFAITCNQCINVQKQNVFVLKTFWTALER